ncbi:enhanced intracellular survival protein Eis [Vulgatibacter sp.]|uniref:GNAT family N-acetyltransferase n=1 Tax=Vulgatibacter sp. TaxID=1971226 RepID=UPI003565269D
MSAQLRYGPVEAAADLDRLVRFTAESFAVPAEEERRWLDKVGLQNVRVLHEGSTPVAGLSLLPDFGQYFGGRRIPCAGIAGVASDARSRGRGAGTALMRAAVQELHGRGIPLAALYPATQPLYRRAGFEGAGGRWRIRVDPAHLDLADRTLPLRAIGEEERPALAELHRQSLRAGNGGIDRSGYLWERVFHPGGQATAGTGVVGTSGALEGYVIGLQVHAGEGNELRLTDLVATTPQAATRLLTFLADHRHQIAQVSWHGAAADPLLALVREQKARVELAAVWMLRIVDVAGALASRGYPEDLVSELHLEIFDEVVPENRGRFLLEVAGGVGRVRPGGEGRLKLHVRGLAPLFSGWMAPEAIALSGLLEGDETERRRARSIFAGPAPALRDFF